MLAVVFDTENSEACQTALAIVGEYKEIRFADRLIAEVASRNASAAVRYYMDTTGLPLFKRDRRAAESSLTKAAELLTPKAFPNALIFFSDCVD